MTDPLKPTHSDRDISLPRTDQVISQILDDGQSTESAADLSTADRRRVADMQWLDALLGHSLKRNQAATEQAVSAVISRLRESVAVDSSDLPVIAKGDVGNASSAPRSPWRWTRRAVVAAILLLVGSVWWNQAPNAALAMIEQAYQAALHPIDRTYRVTIESSLPSNKKIEGTLTVRGGQNFLFEYPGRLGRESRLGKSGSEYWFVPPIGPVLLADDNYFSTHWINRDQSAEMPFLQLTTVLTRLRHHYDIKVLPDEALEEGGIPSHHLFAQRRSRAARRNPQLPESIELWVDHNSDTVQRLILTRSSDAARPHLRMITFNLTGEEQRPDDFYRYNTYAANRSVIPLPEQAASQRP